MQAESFPFFNCKRKLHKRSKNCLKSHLNVVHICAREQHGMKFWMCWKKKCKIRSVGEGCAVYINEIISWHFTIAYVLNFAVYAHKCSHRFLYINAWFALCISIHVEVDSHRDIIVCWYSIIFWNFTICCSA